MARRMHCGLVPGCSWQKPLKLALLGVGSVVNIAIFLAFPAYCSYGSVRHFERELQATEAALPQIGNPDNLLIVSFDNHLLGYRHAGYYFPGYLTIEYPEANLIEGKRIFAMRDRNTFLPFQLASQHSSPLRLVPSSRRATGVRRIPRKSRENAPRPRPEQVDLAAIGSSRHPLPTSVFCSQMPPQIQLKPALRNCIRPTPLPLSTSKRACTPCPHGAISYDLKQFLPPQSLAN